MKCNEILYTSAPQGFLQYKNPGPITQPIHHIDWILTGSKCKCQNCALPIIKQQLSQLTLRIKQVFFKCATSASFHRKISCLTLFGHNLAHHCMVSLLLFCRKRQSYTCIYYRLAKFLPTHFYYFKEQFCNSPTVLKTF